MYLESGEQFMMSARKLTGSSTTSYFTISIDENDFSKGDNYIGKLRANVSGSVYDLYDDGLHYDRAKYESEIRRELASFTFEYDKMGPGRIRFAVAPYGHEWIAHNALEKMSLALTDGATGANRDRHLEVSCVNLRSYLKQERECCNS